MKKINVGDHYRLKGYKEWEIIVNIIHNTHGIKGDDENYCCINGEYVTYNLIEIKKSSYQKLKEENAKLKQDIYTLVMDTSFYEPEMVKAKYMMKFQLADAVLSGSSRVIGKEPFDIMIDSMKAKGKSVSDFLAEMRKKFA